VKKKKMIFKANWKAFRKSGMLWFVNRIIHIFGWSLVVEIDSKQNITDAYPARVKFRGFDEKSESKGFIAVSNFIVRNASRLRKDCDE